VILVIVGEGPERANIEQMCREMQLEESVRLLGNRSDVHNVLHALDVAVLCSDMEAFSNAILEYMAAGKPVVATRVGSVEEQVEEGKTALLVPPRNPKQLADAILQLLRDPDTAAAMGLAGRKRVVRCFSIENMAREREDLFESLLKRKRRLVD